MFLCLDTLQIAKPYVRKWTTNEIFLLRVLTHRRYFTELPIFQKVSKSHTHRISPQNLRFFFHSASAEYFTSNYDDLGIFGLIITTFRGLTSVLSTFMCISGATSEMVLFFTFPPVSIERPISGVQTVVLSLQISPRKIEERWCNCLYKAQANGQPIVLNHFCTIQETPLLSARHLMIGHFGANDIIIDFSVVVPIAFGLGNPGYNQC